MEVWKMSRFSPTVGVFISILLLGSVQFIFLSHEFHLKSSSVFPGDKIQHKDAKKSELALDKWKGGVRPEGHPRSDQITSLNESIFVDFDLMTSDAKELTGDEVLPEKKSVEDSLFKSYNEVNPQLENISPAQTVRPSLGSLPEDVQDDSPENEYQRRAKKRFADDTEKNRATFLERSTCHEGNMRADVPLGQACALQLKVNKLAEKSRDFDFITERLRSDMRQMSAIVASKHVSSTNTSRKKRILMWGNSGIFLSMEYCPECELVGEDNVTNPEDIDAIVLNSFLLLKKGYGSGLPTREQYTNAKIVDYEYEPTQRSRAFLLDGLVDYTYGYRRDSDIMKSNGYIVPRDKPFNIKGMLTKNKSKTKMAAWMVSNCKGPSLRLQLAETLQKHGVEIDIYGECGPFDCPKKNYSCWMNLGEEYKFYMAFENTLCNHYVTEKFFRSLVYKMVPITYGLGHELTGAPKDSYIDVFDFADVKSLAEHILYLDSNITAYNEYFKWREYYAVERGARSILKICQLCKMLVDNTPPAVKYKKGELEAWLKEGQCIYESNNTRIRNFVFGLPQV